MKLIDGDALKEAISKHPLIDFTDSDIFELIDNAPTVEYPCVIKVKTEVDTQRISDELRRLTKMGVVFPIEDIEVKRLERQQGEWLIEGGTTFHFSCSQCGCAGDKWDKFCRHCGASMKGGVEE